MNVVRSVGLFVAAGLAEIGGGYLVWRWLREGSPWPVGLAGAVILVIYGVIPTFQPSNDFGRVYAAYGGVFVIMSLLWGWGIDGHRPDNYDWLGAAIVAAGVAVIFFSPHRLNSYFLNGPCRVRSPSRPREDGGQPAAVFAVNVAELPAQVSFPEPETGRQAETSKSGFPRISCQPAAGLGRLTTGQRGGIRVARI